MSDTVTLTIDNHTVTVPAGTLVVDAARQIGVDIPVFCYHPKMEPVGMCRMCLVEIGRPVINRETGKPELDENGDPVIRFGPKLETSCTVTVSEGMVIRGFSEKAKAGRQEIVEFILTSHPLDCPICDKGGECPLQNLTMAHGPGKSRFLLDDKIHFAKHVPLGDLIFLDRERCIQCARCTRFQDEVADDPVIGFFNRGRRLEIVTHSDPGFDSYWSGNTTDICPVGALTTADFRFGARPWELNSAASICNQCPVGCNITLNTRREAKSGGNFVIKRVMPRQNEEVNEIWLCDKGRFSAYHFSESEDRITVPMVRKDGELVEVTWEEAFDAALEGLKETNLLSLVSGRLSNEDLHHVKRLTDHLGGQAALYTHLGGGDLVAQFGLSAGSNLGDLGEGDAVLVIASDLEEEAPLWWLRLKQAAERGAQLVVANPRPTKLDRAATHIVRYAYGEEVAALQRLPEAFLNAEKAVIFYGSEGLGLAESASLAAGLAELVASKGWTGVPNAGLVAVHPRANDQGAWELGFRPPADWRDVVGKAGAVWVAGADPVGDGAFELEGVFTIVQDVLMTETARRADVIFPAAAFVEREGSYTSGERRVQRFYPAVPVRGQAKPDFSIVAELAERLGLELEARFASRAFTAMASDVPVFEGLTYIALARTELQLPIVGREDMYYGGTTYENAQGLGVQLPPGRQNGSEPAVWKAPAGLEADLRAVPITVLYDRGTIAERSSTLSPRLAEPHVRVSPADGERLGVQDGARVLLDVAEQSVEMVVRVDADVPSGHVLVPRSMGIWLDGPAAARLEIMERSAAA